VRLQRGDGSADWIIGCVTYERDDANAAGGRLYRLHYDTGKTEEVTRAELRSRLLQPPPGSSVLPTPYGDKQRGLALAKQAGRRFKGINSNAPLPALFTIRYGHRLSGTFPSAVSAALAYDTVARQHGDIVVNFPRPGSNEVVAVRGEPSNATAKRARERALLSGASAAATALMRRRFIRGIRHAAGSEPAAEPKHEQRAAFAQTRGKRERSRSADEDAAAAPPPQQAARKYARSGENAAASPGDCIDLTGDDDGPPAVKKEEGAAAVRDISQPPHHRFTPKQRPPQPAATHHSGEASRAAEHFLRAIRPELLQVRTAHARVCDCIVVQCPLR
jgi:hypothetical protein